MKRCILLVILIVSLSIGFTGTLCFALTSPSLIVITDQNRVTAFWSSIDDVEGYTLLLAPYPDASNIYEVDMGSQTTITAELWENAAFYIVIKAYTINGNSLYSNIEHFIISPPGGDITDPGNTTDTDSDTYIKTGAYEQDGGDVSQFNQAYAATEADQSGIYLYNGGIFTLTDSTVTKTGDTSNTDASDFYGLNAIVLAEDSSTVTLSNCVLSSDAEGANGAFAYGEGSSITLHNCKITTTKNSSRGVDATYGGSVTVSNTTIATQGDHCAALATDRGEGSITAINCTGTTQGEGSPGIYSTGTFNVTGGSYTAYGSEAAVIEGLNSITLKETSITGSVKRGVMIYQSMSGDSTVGTGTFNMSQGSLINNSTGPLFFVCNTTAVIDLNEVGITSNGTTFLKAAAPSADDPDTNTSWGDQGGIVTLSAKAQTLDGDILCDQYSTITLTLSNSSNLKGTVNTDNGGDVSLVLDETSSWSATGSSFINNISGVVLSEDIPINIDAEEGVTIYYSTASDGDGNSINGKYILVSGGVLQPL